MTKRPTETIVAVRDDENQKALFSFPNPEAAATFAAAARAGGLEVIWATVDDDEVARLIAETPAD